MGSSTVPLLLLPLPSVGVPPPNIISDKERNSLSFALYVDHVLARPYCGSVFSPQSLLSLPAGAHARPKNHAKLSIFTDPSERENETVLLSAIAVCSSALLRMSVCTHAYLYLETQPAAAISVDRQNDMVMPRTCLAF